VRRAKLDFPDSICALRYEDLISDQRKQLALLGEFLEIHLNNPSSRACNQSLKAIVLSSESWKSLGFKKKLASTNRKYHRRFYEGDAAVIERIVGKRMASYGYAPFFNQQRNN
jgi:hypothetical protein